jgi:hypothetical protein
MEQIMQRLVKQTFKQMTMQGRMILAISVLAGAPLTFYGAMQCYRLQQQIADGTMTRGQVVRTIQSEGGFFPMVRIETSQGTVRFTDRSGSHQPEFKDGEELDVFFPQYEPEKAYHRSRCVAASLGCGHCLFYRTQTWIF